MIRFLYRQLITAASPLVYLYLLQRQRRGKEDRERFHERLGRSSLPRPDGPLIWLHAASVGGVALRRLGPACRAGSRKC